jgi:hypothetical protein
LIDRLRAEIQERLDQLLAEADKLHRALAALDPSQGSSAAPPKRAPAKRAASDRRRARPRNGARAGSIGTRPSAGRPRGARASGQTKSAVLVALAGADAMTAGEVAAAAGLGRGTVSTTLSKLAKSGEVLKAERGYRLPVPGGSTNAAGAAG